MNQDENLDLLDLENDTGVDALPEAVPFTAPRPRKPWLLMGLGFAIIVLATWIIIARVGGDSETSVSVDLDAPVVVDEQPAQPVADLNVPVKPVEVAPVSAPVEQKAEPEPIPQPKPEPKTVVEENGNPVRIVADRKEVMFNPDKVETKPEPKPIMKKPAPQKISAPKKAAKPVVSASNGSIYVQFGSYSTRALAQSAEQKIRKAHSGLFADKQFVILAAEVKGQTTYRLRIAFHNANEANGFCRNAKSDGLDCYVTK